MRLSRYLLVAPGLLGLAAYVAGLLYTLYLSMYYYSLFRAEAPRFVGLGNYLAALGDPTFQKSVLVTTTFVASVTALEVALGVLFAYWIYISGKRWAFPLLTVPLLIPVVSYVVFWYFAVDFRRGLFANAAALLGLSMPNLLGDPGTALWAIVALDVLQLTPFVVLIVLAGMLGIPGEVMWAARIDGARRLPMAFKVVLPMAKTAILAALMLRLIDAFRIFAKVWLLTRGGPGDATTTLEVFLYTRGIYPLDIGTGAAVSILIAALVSVVAIPYVYLVLRTWRA
jgi:multiple sugar transport system permease protein